MNWYELALNIARRFDSKLGGCASIDVKWNPYENRWEATASWSNSNTEGGISYKQYGVTADDSVDNLMLEMLRNLHYIPKS